MTDDAVGLITNVLREHRMHWGVTKACHECTCGGWCDSGPGPKRVQANFEDHVAEAIEAAIGLGEKDE